VTACYWHIVYLHPIISDILLNVFLAIAVDNLADADSMDDEEEEAAKLLEQAKQAVRNYFKIND